MSEPDQLHLPGPVVTGEGVALDLRPASVLTRGLALAVDAVVLAVVGVCAGAVLNGLAQGADDAALGALGLGAVVVVLVVLPATWEALSRGRSPGKAALGLRVVRDDGGPVRARHAALRHLVGFAELWGTGGSVAVITSLVHPRGKRVGDLLAGTYVVGERSGAATPRRRVEPAVPAELAAWAAGADIGSLPDEVAARARWVLGRSGALEAASRERLLADLAAQVAQRVAPGPPPGTADADILAAVLGERRRRDVVRLSAQRERRDVLAQQSRRIQGL